MTFWMNGYQWRIIQVHPFDSKLVDRTRTLRVATTDPSTMTVCISSQLRGTFKTRVIIHELGHCAIFSFNLFEDIHRMVRPEYWIEAEEWVCNFIADYGGVIFRIASSIVGEDAIYATAGAIEGLFTA